MHKRLLTIFTARKSMHGYEVYKIDMDGKNKTNISSYKDVAWAYYADALENKRDEAIDG